MLVSLIFLLVDEIGHNNFKFDNNRFNFDRIMKRKTYCSILLFAFSFVALGQEMTIKGVVLDSMTREILPFTNVGVLGKDMGTVSNSEGSYALSSKDLSLADTVFFSYVGYQQRKYTIAQLKEQSTIFLSKNAVQLSAFSVRSREYTPVEILDLVRKNFSINHNQNLTHQKVFSRDASYTTIHESEIDFKKSSFEAIDGRFVYEFNQNMPEQLNVYNDYLVDLYSHKSERKLVPIEGQSLIENWSFDQEFDKRLKLLAGDVEENVREEDKYFKVRSGIFAGKLDFGADSTFKLTDDSMNYITSPKFIRADLNYLIRTYSTIYSKRWDFFTEYDWYKYEMQETAIVNNELAYIIRFSPLKQKAKYEGMICVAVDSYALLQVDYAFAEGKTGTGMSLLGVEYLVADRRGHVIYEKGKEGYHLKYLSRESNEHFAVNRKIALKQKEESGLFDKTIREVKLVLNLDVSFKQKKELLVVSHRSIDDEEYNAVLEPESYKLKKVSKYASDIWKNNSILEPTKALKEYQQQY